MKSHKDLDVWNKSIDLVEHIYCLTKGFPKEEIYGLTSQVKRAASSIPANIAEGAARQSNKEFCRFLYIAMGSAAELETHLIIAERLKFMDENSNIMYNINDIQKMLSGLIRYLQNKITV